MSNGFVTPFLRIYQSTKTYFISCLVVQNKNYYFLPLQADDVSASAQAAPTVNVEQIIEFDDAEALPPMDMSNFLNKTFDTDHDDAADLAGYLSRPVRIASIPWVEGVLLDTAINPWGLFFDNLYIKKKLDNFARLRCDLHLKFVINSSPFYYGCVRAAWRPMHFPIRVGATRPEDRIPFSQAPGVYLEPSKMSSVEMVLPFLWSGAWLDIGVKNQFDDMGNLDFVEYAALQSANGVVGSGITISVYAWASNIKLCGPTTGLALQSDEYADKGTGTISGPATTMAKIASMFSNVPVIGPFAKATTIGAKAVSSIAKIFGYSNPPVIDDVHGFHPKAFHAFANVETRMPIDRLCVDPKNEVTIDNSVCNVDGEDPLSFSNTIGRESFVESNVWTSAMAVNTPIFTGLVAPGQTTYDIGAIQNREYMTPLCYFGRMFDYWRGSIVYTIKFVKTKYHKGRVVISWDPNLSIIGVNGVETAIFSKVVDLELQDEVEFTIPYKAISPYLRNTNQDLISPAAVPVLTLNKLFHNGMFTVRVLNVLSGPAANPSVDLLLYMRPGDDFRYAKPKELTNNLTTLTVQSNDYVDSSITHETPTHDSAIDLITVGESFISLRPLLHRTSLSHIEVFGQYKTSAIAYVPAGNQLTTNLIPRIPPPFGYDPTYGLHWGASLTGLPAQRINYAKNHPLRYILNAFVGYRGSTNIHVNPVCPASINYIDSLAASRLYQDINYDIVNQNVNRFTATSAASDDSSLARASVTTSGAYTRKSGGQSGISLTNTNVQSALSVNVPQYSQMRFSLAPYEFKDLPYRSGTKIYDNVQVTAQFSTDTAGSALLAWPSMEVYYSAGVDFNPVFFVAVPFMYTYGTPNPNNAYTPV